VQVRRALESPLGSLYISKDHLSIGLSKDSWLRVVIFPMGMALVGRASMVGSFQMRTLDWTMMELESFQWQIVAQIPTGPNFLYFLNANHILMGSMLYLAKSLKGWQ